MERLGRVEEGVQPRPGHRRASCVDEAEERGEFRRLDLRQDHCDRLAVAGRSAVRQQHFLKAVKPGAGLFTVASEDVFTAVARECIILAANFFTVRSRSARSRTIGIPRGRGPFSLHGKGQGTPSPPC